MALYGIWVCGKFLWTPSVTSWPDLLYFPKGEFIGPSPVHHTGKNNRFPFLDILGIPNQVP